MLVLRQAIPESSLGELRGGQWKVKQKPGQEGDCLLFVDVGIHPLQLKWLRTYLNYANTLKKKQRGT
jgi:hypothetical protein